VKVMSEMNNLNLSIIENVNVTAIQQTMQKINQFQQLVKNTLKEGYDYGIIPGTGNKPTLLKPGAEKILMLLGLTSEYEIVKAVEDYKKGFFDYTVKCMLYKNGMKITEGVGKANTREKKYIKQDPFSIANTVLKIAKKRAQIDATLTVAALSEIFTQDLDEDIEGTPVEEKASSNQINYIHKLLKDKNISDEKYREFLQKYYNVETSKDLTKKQASEVIDILSKKQPKEQQQQEEQVEAQ
jgi:hypothetical protein